jgi:hypothetical protein
MNYEQVQWVALPQFLFLNKNNLKYQDSIIYLTIRSYMNNETGLCFPSYETIAAKAKVSKDFVMDSVRRLSAAGMIDVHVSKCATNRNNPNHYSFAEFKTFEQISSTFFEDYGLTYTEKAMLLCIRQFCVHGLLTTVYTIKQIAELLGETYRIVHAQIRRLIEKGYLIQSELCGRNGKVYFKKFILTNRINWITNYQVPPTPETYPVLKVA